MSHCAFLGSTTGAKRIFRRLQFCVVFKVLFVMSTSTALGRLLLQKNHFAVGTLALTPKVIDTKGETIPYEAAHSSRNV